MYRLVYVYLCLFLHSPAFTENFDHHCPWVSMCGYHPFSLLLPPSISPLCLLFQLMFDQKLLIITVQRWVHPRHISVAVLSCDCHMPFLVGHMTIRWLVCFFMQVGNCVAKRNYRYFYLFLVTITIGCIYVMGCNVAVIVIGECWQDKQTNKQTSINKVFTCLVFFSLFSFERG